MEFFRETIYPNFNYWVYVILMMIGMHAMIVKNNLIKKLIGMTIFQTAIILFYVSIGVKSGATIPILEKAPEKPHAEVATETAKTETAAHPAPNLSSTEKPGDDSGKEGKKDGGSKYDVNPDPNRYANPLPHVLMLTAIVVGVSTLGVALAISQSIFRDFKTLEEDEILTQIKEGGPTRDA